ncbi:hypothetical protein IFM89_024379 [Coptis chinensis]|uniref:Mitochondrial import inner membrane translocase subunit TIM23 n=1 Tax=Coptis chinensis TaxID=261450 RepID=A0A835IWY8_9MAGN|nr:hypothetical protein IFM89_024379 [Coptis chinensis]
MENPNNPKYDLNKIYDLDFLFQEEAGIQRRSWGENVTYYAGSGYLTGILLGGSRGIYEGIKSGEKGESRKIRVSRILNSTGARGSKLGNSLAALGLIYAGLESGIVGYRNTDDVWNNVLAGLGTGAFYKVASGPRTAVVAGVIGGLAAGAVAAGKHVVKRYVPI